jgi:drug/metabolite transporter (DMT)-like permease
VTWAYGIGFSLAIGTSDFFGAFLARRVQALTVVITFLVFGTVTVGVLLAVVDGSLLWGDVGFGAASGLTSGFALLLLYHGMAVSSAAVVSPVTALLTALVPVGWGIATGDALTGLAVAGAVVALVGLVGATVSPELGQRAVAGLGWGLGAGTCFGVGFTLLGQVSQDSGMWAALAQRLTAMAVLLVIAAARGVPRVVPRHHLGTGAIGGLLAGLGVGAFVAGAQRGSLSELALTSSVFPAVTVVLAAVFEQHPLRWWQAVGVVLAVVGVGLIGLG